MSGDHRRRRKVAGARDLVRGGRRLLRRRVGGPLLCALAGLALLAAASRSILRVASPRGAAYWEAHQNAPQLCTLRQLLASPLTQIGRYDIALMNLLCAEGLPGADNLDTQQCLVTLDAWAERVRSETERHLYRFKTNPAEFNRSEGYFRMLMISVVLYEDFAVRYNPARITAPGALDPADHFAADSRDLFLHGLLMDRGPRTTDYGPSLWPPAQPATLSPRPSTLNQRLGTCSSMPILYIAVGRRLAYPLRLVTTKAHLFIRWESATERFNVEATGKGMNRYDDAHFKQWPFPVTEDEIRADGFLKSLTPAEELAVFLSLRGHCLREAGRTSEAGACYAQAARLAPGSRAYQLLLASANQVYAPPPSNPGLSPVFVSQPSTLSPQPLPPDPNPRLKLRSQ